MGFLDKFTSSEENISESTAKKAIGIIRELSGSEIGNRIRMVDNLIVITGASGGTGASTLIENIAYTCTKKGLRTLIVDLNVMCPTQSMYLGIQYELGAKDLVDYALNGARIGDCILSQGDLSLLAAGNRTLMDAVNCQSDIAASNVQQALTRMKALYDIVIVDCPMCPDNMLYNTALYLADQIYVVWDEGISSPVNTDRMRKNMALCGIEAYTRIKIIMNKRTGLPYNKGVLDKLNLELIGSLPFDREIVQASTRGEIFCKEGETLSKSANMFVEGIRDITDKILEIGGYIDPKKKEREAE